MSRNKDPNNEYLRNKVSIVSDVLLLYMNKVVDKGMKKSLDFSDLYKLDDSMNFDYLYPKFKTYYDKEKKGAKIGVGRILINYYKWSLVYTGLLIVISRGLDCSIPIMISLFISWLQKDPASPQEGALYCAAIVLAFLTKQTIYRRSQMASSIDQIRFSSLVPA